MIRLEIRPGTGGADAETFATELANAIARHAHTQPHPDGTTWVLDRL